MNIPSIRDFSRVKANDEVDSAESAEKQEMAEYIRRDQRQRLGVNRNAGSLYQSALGHLSVGFSSNELQKYDSKMEPYESSKFAIPPDSSRNDPNSRKAS
mmetsp:Transcript_23457/g.36139  ORF Transcript_23457/g.36139 Transcript_23457/m.36139 type:complete len:100 (-) Transcript_23457:258-557(-)